MEIAEPANHHGRLITTLVDVVLLTCAVVFSKLTIEISEATLRTCFGMGLVCKIVPPAEIATCEPIRIRWWYGWGIHLTPYGWLYNVSGLDAVAIVLRDGRKFSLGTDDPGDLTLAIRRFGAANGA